MLWVRGLKRLQGGDEMRVHESPLISVIVPVYQMEAYLEECVDSILAQTYRHFELWLIDDGSCDRSGKICDAYAQMDERVRIIHQPNRGLSAARNAGLEHAAGEYIAHIDADDTVEEGYLETLLSLCQRHQVRLSACNHLIVRENGRTSARFSETEGERVIARREACSGLLYHDIPDASAWGKLFHRSLFVKARYPEGRFYEDTALIGRLVLAVDEIAYTSRPLYRYRIRQDSISRAAFSQSKLDFLWAVDRLTEDILNAYPDMTDGALRRKVHAALSVRRYFVDCGAALKEQRGQLEEYVRQNGRAVLRNRRAPMRDKLAVAAVYGGSFWYDLLWKALQRMR